MLAKFSVKKPFTVVVAVILILIIGTIAYLNTGVDLLPDLELPYVVVMTSDVGASPEEVETNVTKPMEATLSSLNGMKSISSISAQDYSMIVLQFQQSTNMDSAMIELSSYIDIVEANFDEGVSAPVVMRINPSMLPVMMLAADKDDMSEVAFSSYVEESLQPALERIDGVASVEIMGLVEDQVEIVWDKQAIEELNDRILAAVDSELAETKAELDDAKQEIDDGQAKLDEQSEEAYQDLAEAAGELNDGRLQLQLAQNAMDSAPEELDAAREELENTRTGLEGMLDLLDALDEIEDYIATMEDTLAELDAAEEAVFAEYGSYAAAKRALDEIYDQLETAQSGLDEAAAAYEAALASGDPAAIAQAQGMLIYLLQTIADNDPSGAISLPEDYMSDPLSAAEEVSAQLSAAMETVASSKEQITELQAGKKEAEAAYTELLLQRTKLETVLLQAGGMDRDDIYDALDQIDEGLEEIDEAEAELPGQQQELDDAKEELTDGEAELEKGKMTLSTELSAAGVQLALAEAQLDTAYEEFEDAREEAFENAGLDGVLTTAMLSGILSASNFSMPAGYLEGEEGDTLVKVGDKFTSMDQLKSLLLLDLDVGDIGPVYVEDVANIRLTDNSGEYYAKINGNPGILLSLSKQSMFSTAEVSAAINTVLDELMAEDEGLHLNALYDQGYYIDVAVGTVMDNLLLGGILAILILIFFLRNIRSTIIVGVSIPISLMFALGMMYFSGVNINVISLAGLAMGVGMLVDNSIVVIENIIRLRREGTPAAQAAVIGAKQIAGAITASTLTTVCVFLPIVFTNGLARQLFVDMGLTVAYSLVASLLVALTLVPMLAANTLKKVESKESRFHQATMTAYGKILNYVLRHKWAIFVPVIAVACYVGFSAYYMGTGFIPDVDYGELQITLTEGEHEYSEIELQAIADDVTERIMEIDGIQMVGAWEGEMGSFSSMGSGNEYTISLYVLCDYEAGLSGREAKAEILELVTDVPAKVVVESASFDLSALTGSGVEVSIEGEDNDVLAELAQQVAEIMNGVEGLTQIEAGLGNMAEELRVTVDKNKAMEYGLTVAQVFQSLAEDLNTETEAMTLSEGGYEYPVLIVEAPEDAMTREKLYDYRFTVESTDENGETVEEKVYLTDIATIREASGFSSITRVDQTRTHSVTAAIDDEHNIGLVSRELEDALSTLSLPSGYRIEMGGENENIQDTMGDLYLMIAMACAFIYLIMVAQFQSLLLPFIVLFTIPLAFTGGLLALVISGNEISVVAMLGFLVLAGVIVNNGIVFVDCVNQLRIDEGMEKRAALVRAGQMRLRPILMTALTTIFALMAIAFSSQMGSELLQPMALVAIGGLVYATFLTLLLVPALYDLLQRKKQPASAEVLPLDTEHPKTEG